MWKTKRQPTHHAVWRRKPKTESSCCVPTNIYRVSGNWTATAAVYAVYAVVAEENITSYNRTAERRGRNNNVQLCPDGFVMQEVGSRSNIRRIRHVKFYSAPIVSSLRFAFSLSSQSPPGHLFYNPRRARPDYASFAARLKTAAAPTIIITRPTSEIFEPRPPCTFSFFFLR